MENNEKGHPANYNEDEARLADVISTLHYYTRQFTGLQNFGFTLTNASVLIGIVPLYGFGMMTGGPLAIVWGWILTAFFVMFIGLSMAEICSTFPTAGGLYFWTAKLGGEKWGPMFSWYEAWFNMLGQVAGCSGSVLSAATFLNYLIVIWRPEYYVDPITEGKRNFYVMAGLMILAGVINTAGGRALKMASLFSVFIHIVGTIVIIVAVLASAPKLQSAKFVFTDFEDFTGYTTSSNASPVFVFMLGLLQSQWSMLGYDASAHMSEETEKSYVNGPRGILMSILASVLIGLGLALALTFGIQDYEATFNSTIGAAPQIFIDTAGKKLGTVLMLIIVSAGFLCGVATVAANSRMIYAFARDGGLPFSPFWTTLNKRTQMPLRLVWLSVVITIVLALPSLGSTATLSAISGISIIGFTVSYAIPVLLRITVGATTFVQREFNLGSYSKPIGWVAVIWTAFIFVIFNLPQSWPVTNANTFNFTPAAVGFLLLFTTSSWFLSARHWFKGPVSEIALLELEGKAPASIGEKEEVMEEEKPWRASSLPTLNNTSCNLSTPTNRHLRHGNLYSSYHKAIPLTFKDKLQSQSAHGSTDIAPSILLNRFGREYSSYVDQDHGSKTDERVFFFDIDNCLYSKKTGIPQLMKERIEKYFRDSGIAHDEVETLAHRYYVDYGLAIRGLVERHPGRPCYSAYQDIADYDDKVDGALPLETLLEENLPLRRMIQSMNVGKKWLFTNAGESHAKRVIRILGLQGLFQGITFCNYLEHQFVCKPDKKAFEKAMTQAGVKNPELCYFVDDSVVNVEMATKMGWTTVHVNEGSIGLKPSGNFQIVSIMDLPKVLPQFWDHKD
ncbi:hypothetical protein BGZ49_010164 [Haplosporangium sp. Z 27]|nr:hypothetical protein BGZ49_010164 [Haplosporangium sp. Z 27]